MKNRSRLKHVTYDQAGGARNSFLRSLQVTLSVKIHPDFSEVVSLIYNLESLRFWTCSLLQKYKIKNFLKINLRNVKLWGGFYSAVYFGRR